MIDINANSYDYQFMKPIEQKLSEASALLNTVPIEALNRLYEAVCLICRDQNKLNERFISWERSIPLGETSCARGALPMTTNQKLELEARAFEIMTGRMAPFKDSPAAAGLADIAERAKCWKEWREHYSLIIRAMERAMEEQEEKP